MIIPIPTTACVSTNSNADLKQSIAFFSAVIIFSSVLWIIGYIHKKINKEQDNIAEIMGKGFTLVTISFVTIALIAYLIYQIIK